MKMWLRILCLIPLMAMLAGQAFGAAIWVQKFGDVYSTNKSLSTIGAADAFMSPTGLGWLGPGTETLTLPTYRPGVCWIWQRYDAFRVTGTPFEAWPRGVRQLRVDSLGVRVDSVLTTPRLGPYSTYNSGGAIRIVDGVKFPLTVAGVQAAMDELETAGGGTCMVPAQAGISVTTTTLKIPNRVKLMGMGSVGTPATFVCTSTCNVGAVIENKNIDGTQQYAYVEGIGIDGSRAGGATDSVGIRFRSVFVQSAIRDVKITAMKGDGIVIDDPGDHSCGLVVLDNLWIFDLDGDGIRVGTTTVGRVGPINMKDIDIERWGTGKAAVRLQGRTTGSASASGYLKGFYMEEANDATAEGLVLKDYGNFTAEDIRTNGTGTMNYPVKIEGTTPTTNIFGSHGAIIRNVQANNDTMLFDQVNNYAIVRPPGSQWYFHEYITPSIGQSVLPRMQISDSLHVIRRAMFEDTLRVLGTGDFNNNLDVQKKGIFGDSLRANLGLYVGGQFVNKILRASATLDFDLTAVVSQDLTITVTGAAVGDEVFIGVPNGSVTADTIFYGWVSAANTVTVRATRAAGTPNPASGTFKVTVFQ